MGMFQPKDSRGYAVAGVFPCERHDDHFHVELQLRYAS